MSEHGRVYKWDNLKCILIFLVVIGHFSNQFDSSDCMKSLSIFIYSFHMPLFIFLSGLLEKGWTKDHPFRWNKPIFYIVIGFVLKICIYVIKLIFHEEAVFSFWGDTGLPWYMFAMAAFMVLMYVLRSFSGKIVLPILILIACMAGYVESIGSFLYLSRIIVFFPFYYMGYKMNPKKLMEYTDHTWVRAGSAGILLLAAMISILKISDIYSFIRMMTGRNAYSLIRVADCGFQHRLLFYGIAVIMSVAVISLVPNRSLNFATLIGQKTLQIYFWHRLVLYVMMYSGFVDQIREYMGSAWIGIYLLIAVALTLGLVFDVFGYPLDAIRKQERWVERHIMRTHTSVA